MAKRSQGWVKCEDRLPYFPTTKKAPTACHLPLATTPRPQHPDSRGPRRGPGRPGPRARSSGALAASMQREGAVPDSFVQNKMTRTSHLRTKALTNHLELLVRAALKSVFELCSLIASRSFSAPPNCNPLPNDRHFRLLSCQCSYSTILRGWLALPASHSGWSTPMPHRSFFCRYRRYLLLACSLPEYHPSRPPLTV
jgi:hypothetical protein